MADADEPQFTTLAERIAALNKQKNFQSAEQPKQKRPPPPPPPTKPDPSRSQTFPVAQAEAPAPTLERQTPAIPPRPTKAAPAPKANPPPLPRRDTESVQPEAQPAASNGYHNHRPPPPPPPEPARASTVATVTPPALPARRPSAQHLNNRRGSNASEVSSLSSLSLGHGTVSSATSVHSVDNQSRKLPPAYDPNSLPPLPPSKRERDREAQAREASHKPRELPQVKAPPSLPSHKSTPAVRQVEPPQRPNLPPRQTNRSTAQPAQPLQSHVQEPAPQPAQPPRRLPPPVIPPVKSRSETNGYSQQHQQQTQQQEESRPLPVRPPIPTARPREDDHHYQNDGGNGHVQEDEPPPIPLSSRPTFSQIEAACQPQAAPPPAPPQQDDCLICRDFSGPDGVAAQHPRSILPQNDPVGYLANALCAPFVSYTDKARAIFTWFHHNIAYDCEAFFGNSVRARGAEQTISMGKAVCSGYADTYKAIAERAGLECVVVSGHGKGVGFTALKKGERPPPKKVDGHAWNAVRIDGGEWKLLDSCWGAGNVSSATKTFTPAFKPHEFTRRNDVFGLSHYPKNERYFFRPDGRVPTWEEYVIGPVHGETPTVYSNAHQEGVWALTVEPREKQIPVLDHARNGEYVRFQFSKVCEHWTSEKNGLGEPPLLLLSCGGKKKDMIPMDTDGFWWWADVEAERLGDPGDSVSVVMLQKLGGQDARGLRASEFLAKRGKVGMSWSGIIKWDLV